MNKDNTVLLNLAIRYYTFRLSVTVFHRSPQYDKSNGHTITEPNTPR